MRNLKTGEELLAKTNMVASDPREYSIDHDEWRSFQREAIGLILAASEKAKQTSERQFVIAEAPTGSGKTAMAVGAGAAMGEAWTGITITTDLQRQYSDDYKVPTVMGKGRYPCGDEKWCRKYQALNGIEITKSGIMEPTAENCNMLVHNKNMWDCKLPCPYQAAKRTAFAAKCSVLNVHYAYLTRWWREASKLLVFDECHNLSTTLSSLNERSFRRDYAERRGYPKFPGLPGSSKKAVNGVADWVMDVAKLVGMWDGRSSGDRDQSAINAYRRQKRAERLESLSYAMKFSDEGDYHIQITPEQMTIRCADTTVPFKNMLNESGARVVVLMSATVGNPEPIATRLGIPFEQCWFHSVPATFPKENRMVYQWEDAPKLGYKSPDEDWQRVADQCKLILKEHFGQRGIIHTASWYQAKMLKRMIGSKRCYIPEAGNRAEAIEAFRTGRSDAVVISPSWKEGINLPDDECRFGILVKVPFMKWNDPVVQLQRRKTGGAAWYDWAAALDVTQAMGRMVRHSEDWGTGYILDANWNRVAKHAPQWLAVEPWDGFHEPEQRMLWANEM